MSTDLKPVVGESELEQLERLRAQLHKSQSALSALLHRYVGLVNCGDCGNWDPEEEREVMDARAALKETP